MRRATTTIMAGLTRLLRCLVISIFFLTLLATRTTAQSSSTDGSTPLGLSPGTPAGSYALSEFDSVNLYNGHLNFRLPLLSIGGRGGSQMTMPLTVEQLWRVDHNFAFGIHLPVTNWWTGIEPGYGPGVMQGRQVTEGCPQGSNQTETLTRFTFSSSDGTEYELRDTLTGGRPGNSICNFPGGGAARGQVFVTADGSAATFISDTPINDFQGAGEPNSFIIFPTGFLMLRDGTRYHIVNGLVMWMRDRNGNRLTFEYDFFSRVKTITDSLNRVVTVNYDVTDVAPFGLCDQIIFKGFGGVQRIIRISKTNLDNALRATQSGDVTKPQTFAALFPLLNGSDETEHNPSVVSSVWLPDGSRRYQLFYNTYGELARVTLPTGGAFEYDYTAGFLDVPPSGAPAEGDIYRRVVERRAYTDGSVLELKTTYSRPENSSGVTAGFVVVEHRNNANSLVGRERHFFHGSVAASFRQGMFAYPAWRDSREHQAEIFQTDGVTILNRAVHDWQQREPVSWWPFTQETAPPNDPRVTRTTTTLVDTNQVTKQDFEYDRYNNKTKVSEFDFGSGVAGTLIRRTETSFVTLLGGEDYAEDPSIHLRSLPFQEQVFAGSSINPTSQIDYEYDNYSLELNHAPLVDRPSICQLTPHFGTTRLTRGNVTSVKSWLNTSGTWITSFQQYDIAGNVVKTIDARGFAATMDYSDRFGAPDNEARSNAPPAELNGLTTFALVSKVTDALGHEAFTQYDYHLGRPVNAEDSNQVVGKGSHNDILDRTTELVEAVGTNIQRRTLFSYDDVTRTITTNSDLSSFQDGLRQSQVLYDSFGRTIETRTSAPEGIIFTGQEYDALGRVKRIFNPHRSTGEETYGRLDTTYDGLGRVIQTQTFDRFGVSTGAVVTSYSGNIATVRDQANKQRRSTTDALGRLKTVDEMFEHPSPAVYATTTYQYDILDNLIKVTQGSQTRFFLYDSLKRLIRARNPEQNVNSALNLSDPLTGNSQWCMSYGYDPNGNLQTKTDARNITTSHDHDALDRVTSVTYLNDPANTPAVSYKYDAQGLPSGSPPGFNRGYSTGRLVAVTFGGTSAGNYIGYDQLGQPISSIQQTQNQNYEFSYEYNRAGAMTRDIYPSGRVVDMEYDIAGRLAGVKNQQTGSYYAGAASGTPNAIGYAAHGGVSKMKLGNGLWTHANFNSRLQPEHIGLGTTSTTSNIFSLDYTYGTTANNGNVLTQKITVPGIGQSLFQTYSYDPQNRLEEARENQGSGSGTQYWRQKFIYDRFGNRNFDLANTTPNVIGPNPITDQGTNRFASGQNYGYDPAGNLTSDPTTPTNGMAYDAENRLISYTKAGATTQYSYDGDGRRVKKLDVSSNRTTVYVYNVVGQLIAEYQTDPVPPAPGGGGTSYLTTDHLGSTRVVTKPDQSVKARYDFLPFGEDLSPAIGGRSGVTGYGGADGTRQKFTQKERDGESGLDYFLARYYSSAHGRFTSTDPAGAGAQLSDPQSFNRYSYSLNNPLRFTDPDGQIPVETAIDVISFAESFYQLWNNPSWAALGYVIWDAAAIAIPYAPGSWVAKVGKYGFRGMEAAGIVKPLVNALEIAANNDYIRRGVALLGQGGESVNKWLGRAGDALGADFLGVTQAGKYVIGETKGGDVAHAVEQIAATAEALVKKNPGAKVKTAEIVLKEGQKIDPAYSVGKNGMLLKLNTSTGQMDRVTVKVGKKTKQVTVRYLKMWEHPVTEASRQYGGVL